MREAGTKNQRPASCEKRFYSPKNFSLKFLPLMFQRWSSPAWETAWPRWRNTSVSNSSKDSFRNTSCWCWSSACSASCAVCLSFSRYSKRRNFQRLVANAWLRELLWDAKTALNALRHHENQKVRRQNEFIKHRARSISSSSYQEGLTSTLLVGQIWRTSIRGVYPCFWRQVSTQKSVYVIAYFT